MERKPRILPKIIAGALITAIVMALGLFLLFYLFFPPTLKITQSTPLLKIIVAASPTVTIQSSATGISSPNVNSASGFQIGTYVQIAGTGTEGLRFRSAPSKDSSTLFIAMEAEVFKIENGPQTANGYTWWYLSAPYDQNRSGWVVADYLSIISTPVP
jgi:hypothetical protein